ARQWTTAKLGADGGVQGNARGGMIFVPVQSDHDRPAILEATGHGWVYVNGEPRIGDIYGHGYVTLPIQLKKGMNELLFGPGRGRLNVKLREPAGPFEFNTADVTAPDLLSGGVREYWLALPLLNPSAQSSEGLSIIARVDKGAPVATPVPPILPFSSRKVAIRFSTQTSREESKSAVVLDLVKENQKVAEAKLELRHVEWPSTRKETFISAIDGSVQYYAVVPPPLDSSHLRNALVLTLHGASVEAIGQARAYSKKREAVIVAATNRRPYGFDWEDWGRQDAMEVLEVASKKFGTDPSRTYLTGHSMGGHGTWHVGVTYPDRFAAVAPSAGWVSMWSYAGMRKQQDPSPPIELILRSSAPSDTLALSRNLADLGVYVLHGDADDNVPVSQARSMRTALAEFHRDFAYFEEPGAGHWWDKPGTPGADCVDWPPAFSFFDAHRIPAADSVRRIDFRTAHPAVSARCHWASVEAQQKAFHVSRIALGADPKSKKISGTTENVRRLRLDVKTLCAGAGWTFEVDGGKVSFPAAGPAFAGDFEKTDAGWKAIAPPPKSQKGSHRAGGFKDAFRNRFLFVFGSSGTPAENDWCRAKARFDAEQFWYQGNGSVDIVADNEFRPEAFADRNVIVYGHADCNSAWKVLLAESPIQVRRGELVVGTRRESGSDRAALFLIPRPGSNVASVGVVTGTGVEGMRLLDRTPYLRSGAGYPDWMILDRTAATKGLEGVQAAGNFGVDWRAESGESAWRN
ncbi:MAG TPA: prolyl oligopeptidase family serine peptidase, partial [Planctomycetia bacterium]|nr:prolyl oligopeptidase family serine peptidase [Planctomycetia bacterium]